MNNEYAFFLLKKMNENQKNQKNEEYKDSNDEEALKRFFITNLQTNSGTFTSTFSELLTLGYIKKKKKKVPYLREEDNGEIYHISHPLYIVTKPGMEFIKNSVNLF